MNKVDVEDWFEAIQSSSTSRYKAASQDGMYGTNKSLFGYDKAKLNCVQVSTASLDICSFLMVIRHF